MSLRDYRTQRDRRKRGGLLCANNNQNFRLFRRMEGPIVVLMYRERM